MRILAAVLFSLSLYGQSPALFQDPPELTPIPGPRIPKVTQKQLDHIVAYWQRVLSLGDWEISAHLVPIAKLPDGVAGMSHGDARCQCAALLVLRPEDYPSLAERNGLREKRGAEITRDIEDTVVHELVHLRLRAFRLATTAELDNAEEIAVDRLTTALLRARYR